MRLLIDTNVVLDFLQERELFIASAAELFDRIDRGEIQGFIAATTITNIYYIVRRTVGSDVSKNAIVQVLNSLNICIVDREILEHSLAVDFRDFEDAVQYACAIAYNLDAIITRDLSGFVNSEISVVSPSELETLINEFEP